ncbi:polysaccharide deacetylase family sporulation protein PdaB [Dorea acetigenes]|jgi:polysaccharide deacetylase family sporulation protein PdaB|uniref:Polysaccharide deacetylase family sporulation protein PdaB n=1 Tax=Dorea acetigenes TaxID=2981787 RepID=A0ABT2RIE5_9FIRM|nr:polysaccharide deacetylase family sporulation protein PdaB [Dorea acetigenes]MCB6415308.1 polysaccharide deacetylase family sporulation protein PdaB [Faecalimonas umbilicata]MCU6685157.1 polysaccharide deacetylase family sporulation protein PdaB [Dorea acetigenes]SCI38801.1 Probable polysaccharide deacetylase pdaA precursor [uncultured Clostridium sp.]
MQEKESGRWKRYGTLTLVLMIALMGSFKYLSGFQTVSSNVNGRELPIYSVETDEKKAALTFDVAWGNEDTQKILDILKKYNVHAAFFMTGEWVEKYPDEVKAIYAAGHDLGNHSENHKNMSRLSDEEKTEEIMRAHQRVKELTGVEMNLFRPPYGDYNDEVIRNAQENGYYTIQWNVDSLDWKDYGVDSIVKAVLDNKELKNGSIILCHNGAKYTADALESVITGLQEKGYELVSVSELIYKDHYHMDVTGRQIKD